MSEHLAGRGQEEGRGRPSRQDTGTMADRDELAVRLGRLARSLQAEDDQELMLDEVIRGAVELVPGAQGILMERHQLTADQAFRVLARVSQNENRKLHEVAEKLAATGALGDQPERTSPRSPQQGSAG